MNMMVNIPVTSKIFIWTNADLDGAASVILLGNIFKEFEYQSVFFGEFETTYTAWAKKSLENYDKVFVIGMVLDQGLINKFDDPRLVFISDRGESLHSFDSMLVVEECSSCCKLLYKKFKDKINFSLAHKKLFGYVDDYNKYELKYEESKYLNAVYRKSGYKKFATFVNSFWDGFNGFTDSELSLARSFFDEIDLEVAKLELFEGKIKDWTVLATFSLRSVNEIAKALIDKYPHDAIIVVNPESKFVSFRKPVGSPADIKYLAENLCGGGGGEWASGGQMTEKFMNLMTTLVEV